MIEPSTNKTKYSKKEAIEALWRRGKVCDMLLDSNQKSIINMYYKNDADIQVVVFPRQTGKTFCLLVLAVELCLTNKNFIITFVAPKKNQAAKISRTTMREILDTCPPDIRPEYKTQGSFFQFHTGSIIEMAANNAKKIDDCRGPKAHFIICDEVGFWDDLEYAVKSVLYPKLNTTGGKLMMTSTPPKSAGHPFQKFYEQAKFRGASIVRVIFDCPRYTKEQIDKFALELGGYDSIDFRREYMSEFIVDINMAVIPEATDDLMSRIVKEWPTPVYRDKYVSMDIGFKDLTFLLFAYYDFREGKVVIEDEVVMNGPSMTTDKLAMDIYKKETELWSDEYDTSGEPFLRVSDTNLLLINDLYMKHGLLFEATSKDDSEGSINNMRVMLNAENVIINPRCTQLIFHIQNATWKDDRRKEYDRSPEAGHYDGVDSLKYLLRNIQYFKNPYPARYNMMTSSNTFISPHYKDEDNSFIDGVKDIFNLNKRKKKR